MFFLHLLIQLLDHLLQVIRQFRTSALTVSVDFHLDRRVEVNVCLNTALPAVIDDLLALIRRNNSGSGRQICDLTAALVDVGPATFKVRISICVMWNLRTCRFCRRRTAAKYASDLVKKSCKPASRPLNDFRSEAHNTGQNVRNASENR